MIVQDFDFGDIFGDFFEEIFGNIIAFIQEYLWILILVISLIVAGDIIAWIFVLLDARKKHIGSYGLFFFGLIFTGLFGAALYYIITSKMQVTRKMVKNDFTNKKDKPEWQSTCVIPKNKVL